jgi:large subunit ribosomal protein L25
MATTTLAAEPRTQTGKGAARSARRDGRVPGVIYGHAREPQALTVAVRDIEKLLERFSASTVIELSLGGTTSKTLIREVQKHPYKRQILHVDFQELVAGEKVTVAVPLRFVGVPEGVRVGGGILTESMHEVTVFADPSNIPDHIDVDIAGLTIGHSIHVSDLSLPAGVEADEEPSKVVAAVSAPTTAAETTTEVAAETGAEPELIRKAKEDDEA